MFRSSCDGPLSVGCRPAAGRALGHDQPDPAERVAFILHDVFGYPFADVAEITGRTQAACRQLASSARRRVRGAQPPATPTIVKDFKQAWEARDIGALIGLLDPGTTRKSRGGSRYTQPPRQHACLPW